MMSLKTVSLALLLSLPAMPSNAMDIEVRALFSGAALLFIDGRRHMMRPGEVSPEGVELVSASADEAVVIIEGEKHTLHLSERISSNFAEATRAQVQIVMAENRQYITHGSVNGRPVRFLVDTGANVVAINENMAITLGIDVSQGIPIAASTASDNLPVTLVNIREIQVGPIKRNNVQAVVLRGDNPRDVLLGMTFLQHVEITEKSGLMTLTSKM